MDSDAAAAGSGHGQTLSHRLARIVAWLGGVVALLGVLELLGVPALDWIRDLFDKVGQVPVWAIVSGVLLESAQTSLAALAWFGILRAALPRAPLPFRLVLASYAAAVAMNGFLPANLGTFVMLVMFTTLIAGATFPLVFSGLLVEKIPFSILNVALYLYLFVTVSGSFSIKLGFLADHTGLVVLLVLGAIALLVLLARIFWERLVKIRAQFIAGGAILREPRRALVRLGLPVLGSYLARLAIVAVFLGAYGIPVSFHNVATVTASNSISNSVSATPGGVGVTQAMNSAALSGEASAKDATAYSIGQQLIVSAWDVVFAIVLVCWVFGWSGGKQLVESSYTEAKAKSREMRSREKSRA
ncbi:MAG TPA: YbhN family protein [Solirubrobacterales bacterium]|nr:YbhN family protein [Solirubrobacterales bacterium]